ncbi:MAG: SIR2 family protein, partial [Gemmatimonadaceae bacterium]
MLFVGAGLSAAAGLPTWRGLLDDVIATTGEGSEGAPETGELRALLGAGKLLEVAEHCRAKDPQRFNEVLRRRLAVDGVDVPRAHRAIVGLPFAAVVTTNFDRLLERAYETLAHTGAPRAPTYDQLPTLGTLLFEGAFFILKAHGDIGAPDNLVITATDYREISHANPAFADIFSAILLTRAILFVGYSLSDPDFRLLFDRQLTAFPGALPPRYALMTGVGAVEREILKKTAQIQVLPYEVVDGRHDAVPAFLERLREMVATAPAPAVSPLAVEQAGGRKTTATSTTSRTRRAPARVAAAPREPPRPAPPLPVTTLELRRRGASLEAAVVAGDERLASTSRRPLPPWSHWARVIPPALSGYDDGWDARLRAAGAELADMLTEAALGALARVPAEHVIVLRPSP